MERKTMEKLFAILALLWILVWVVSTTVIYLLSPKQVIAPTQETVELTDEQLNQLKEITTWTSWSWEINSWELENTLTWSEENIQSWTINSTWILE